jgi:hypothetical protein
MSALGPTAKPGGRLVPAREYVKDARPGAAQSCAPNRSTPCNDRHLSSTARFRQRQRAAAAHGTSALSSSPRWPGRQSSWLSAARWMIVWSEPRLAPRRLRAVMPELKARRALPIRVAWVRVATVAPAPPTPTVPRATAPTTVVAPRIAAVLARFALRSQRARFQRVAGKVAPLSIARASPRPAAPTVPSSITCAMDWAIARSRQTVRSATLRRQRPAPCKEAARVVAMAEATVMPLPRARCAATSRCRLR